jgi:nitroreductase
MEDSATQALFAHMRSRRHVAPKRLVEPGPNSDELNLIFSAAAQAPDHGRIQPWRFIVVPKEKRPQLGQAFALALQTRDPQASELEVSLAYQKALRAPFLMLGVIDKSPSSPPIPVYERLISMGCAIQNMLLMAQALSIGSGITSGQGIVSARIRALFQLKADEEAICFINLGKIESIKSDRPRADFSEIFSNL